MDIPFLNYHAAAIIDKYRRGQDITVGDINKFIYGSAIERVFSPYFATPENTPFYRGSASRNAYITRYRRLHYGYASSKAYRSGTKYSRKHKRYSPGYSNRRRYR